jgi:hypothetical protein
MDHARKLRIQDIFDKAVQKAGDFRKGVNVHFVGATEESNGLIRAQVLVLSQDGDLKLLFTIGANDEVTGLGPNGWRIPDCLLTPKSIESAIKDAIQWKIGPSPFNSD